MTSSEIFKKVRVGDLILVTKANNGIDTGVYKVFDIDTIFAGGMHLSLTMPNGSHYWAYDEHVQLYKSQNITMTYEIY